MVRAGEMTSRFMDAEQDVPFRRSLHDHGDRFHDGFNGGIAWCGLPHNAAIPLLIRGAVLAQMAGRRIVEMVRKDIRMSDVLKRENFENAIMVNGAIGGSTNAVVHLLASPGEWALTSRWTIGTGSARRSLSAQSDAVR